MGNKLRLQITERYKRNVFINVVVPVGYIARLKEVKYGV